MFRKSISTNEREKKGEVTTENEMMGHLDGAKLSHRGITVLANTPV